VISNLFPLDHFKITEGPGEPFNDFSACCLTVAMCCVIDAKDENKEVGN
jgi:hypothetical protein